MCLVDVIEEGTVRALGGREHLIQRQLAQDTMAMGNVQQQYTAGVPKTRTHLMFPGGG